jgi:uncharacterized protein
MLGFSRGAILPEVDYLIATHVGARAEKAFLQDLTTGALSVAWGGDEDLSRANKIRRNYRNLRLGLVDAVVIAVAERLRAEAIATPNLRHFGAISIRGGPRLLPAGPLLARFLDVNAQKKNRRRG